MSSALFIIALTVEDTEAGVFSFVSELMGGESANAAVGGRADGKTDNSQTMALLEAPISPDSSKSAGSMTIIDHSAIETNLGPGGTAKEVMDKSGSDHVSVYVVRPGDTLSAIAKMFDVSANTIMWANDLKSARDIREGDELVILPISGIKHVVKKGDTLQSIAKKYNGDAYEISRFNDLDASVSLKVGIEIIIPDGESTPEVSKSSGAKVGAVVASGAKNGYFIRPAAGRKTQGLHGRNRSGIDIGNSVGAAIYASAPGKVVIAKMGGWNGGYGNYIVIQHANGMQSLYAHLSSVNVSRGQSVSQGELIGGMGSTGNSTGSHLHFEILGAKNWNPF